jgi:thymidylate synthase (FAD)
MEVVTPKIYMRTPNVFFERMLDRLETAARICYKSEDKIADGTAESLIGKIIRLGHESVLEHECISVRVVCDRGISHEIVRHRIASYSQESTRYCDYGKFGMQIIHPPGLCDEQLRRREELFWAVQRVYDAERDEGISPQIARGVLPHALKTEIVMTLNLRSWRHFLKLRTDSGAHPQIRELAEGMKTMFQKKIPLVFDEV